MNNSNNEHSNQGSYPTSSANSRLRVPPTLIAVRRAIDKATPEQPLDWEQFTTLQPDPGLRWETFVIACAEEFKQRELLCSRSLYGGFVDEIMGEPFLEQIRLTYEQFRCGIINVVGRHLSGRARRAAA